MIKKSILETAVKIAKEDGRGYITFNEGYLKIKCKQVDASKFYRFLISRMPLREDLIDFVEEVHTGETIDEVFKHVKVALNGTRY